MVDKTIEEITQEAEINNNNVKKRKANLIQEEMGEYFKKFQEESGKYKGLDIDEVEFENVCLADKKYIKINPKKSEIDKNLLTQNIKISFVSLSSISPTLGKIDTIVNKNILEVYKGYTYFKEGDIIFTKVTPSMENGNIAIAENLCNNIGFGSSEYYIFRSEIIYNKLLWHLFRSDFLKKKAKKTMKGAGGLKRVPLSFFDTEYIKIPKNTNIYTSYQIQQALVEFLEFNKDKSEHFRGLNNTSREYINNMDNAILPSLFNQNDDYIKEMFVKYNTNPEKPRDSKDMVDFKLEDIEFEIKRIHSDNTDDLICQKRMGFTPSRDAQGDINWLTVADMNAINGLCIDNPNTKEKTTMDLIKKAVDKNNTGKSEKLIPIKKGNILISFKLSVGIVKIYNSDLPIYCNEAIDILIIDDDMYNKYIAYHCIIEYPKYGTQNTQGKTLNDDSKKLIEIKIPKPITTKTKTYSSYEVQVAIVQFLDRFYEWRDGLLTLLKSGDDIIDQIDEAFLYKTFQGSK